MKLFNVSGRAGRMEYFWHSVISIQAFLAVLFLLMMVEELLPDDALGAFSGFIIIGMWLLLVIAEILLTIRRFHDLGKSGTNYFFLLIPIYNIILGLQLLLSRGTIGRNEYGPDPVEEADNGKIPGIKYYLLRSGLLLLALVVFLATEEDDPSFSEPVPSSYEYQEEFETPSFSDSETFEEIDELVGMELLFEPLVGDYYIYKLGRDFNYPYRLSQIKEIQPDTLVLQVSQYNYAFQAEAALAIEHDSVSSETFFTYDIRVAKTNLDGLNVRRVLRE